METLTQHWQLALGCFVAGYLVAAWMSHTRQPPAVLHPEITDAEIEAALRAGQKIQAMRLYRSRTGASLKDTKQAMAALSERIGAK